MQDLTHGAQLQSVIVLQLKDHALAGRQFFQRTGNSRSQLPSHQVALGIRSRAAVGYLIEDVVLPARRVFRDGSIFLAHGLLAQVVHAKIRHDAINPGVERTLETKASDVFVGLEESVLVDVLRVLLGAGQVEGEAQHRLIVVTHEFLEGAAVPALRLANQNRIVYAACLPSHAAPRGVPVLKDYVFSNSLPADSLCSLALC